MRVLGLCPNCKVLLMSVYTAPIRSLEEARAKGFQFPVFEKPLSAQMIAEQVEVFRTEQQGASCGPFQRVGAQ